MIQSKHTFNSVLDYKLSKYTKHKQFYTGFTFCPFIATEHFVLYRQPSYMYSKGNPIYHNKVSCFQHNTCKTIRNNLILYQCNLTLEMTYHTLYSQPGQQNCITLFIVRRLVLLFYIPCLISWDKKNLAYMSCQFSISLYQTRHRNIHELV